MQTFIENKGVTKTIIHNNNGSKDENEIKWKANYDGEKANIDVNFSKNCKKDKLRIELNNSDLASILGMRPNPIPLDQRLKSDFLELDSESESESESESDLHYDLLGKIEDTINPIDSQILEDDISKLLQIKTIKPEVKSSYKPQPYLFRVQLPESSIKPIPKYRPKYRHKHITSSNSKSDSSILSPSVIKPKTSSKAETITVSDMLFDPAFDLSAPPIQLKEPTHIQLPNVLSSLTPETLLPSSILNKTTSFFIPIKDKKSKSTHKKGKNNKKSNKKNAYKTPAPKTYRVHLTSNKGTKKSKSISNTALGLAKKLGII